WPYFGIVRSGELAAIVASRTGREQVLFEIGPLEPFAELETLDGGRTIARIVATSPADVVVIPRDVVLAMAATDTEFARALAISCAQRTRAVVGRLLATVATPTVARVAAAILPYARPEPGLVSSLPELRAVTQGALASAAGTVKEVVARAIAELEAAGALERERGRIARIDREKLATFVDPGV
ncbi:MAG: Crp/Fnr family transcriptional regulator, partial [Candidatus Baltobacteraceae bacterium]